MKNYFRYISGILFFALIGYGIWWVIGVIWLRPANIHIYFQRIALEFTLSSPEKATPLDMPAVELVTPYHALLNEKHVMAPMGQPMDFQEIRQNLQEYNRDRLSDEDLFYYNMLMYWAESAEQISPHLSRLFPLNHIDGIWPRFLYMMDVEYPIYEEAEGVVYIDRLKRWDEKMENTLTMLEGRDPRTYIPAPHLIDSAIHQLDRYLQLPVDQHPLYKAFARKAISSDPTRFNEQKAVTLLGEVSRLITEQINPSLNSARDFLNSVRPADSSDTDEWFDQYRNPNNYYPDFMKFYGSSELDIDSVFESGVIMLDSLQALRDSINPVLGFDQAMQKSYEGFSAINEMRLNQLDSLYTVIQVMGSGLFEFKSGVQFDMRYYDGPLCLSSNIQYTYLPYEIPGRGILTIQRNLSDLYDMPYLPVMAYYHGFPGLHTLKASQWQREDPYFFRHFLDFPAFEQGWALYSLTALDQHLQLFSNQPIQKWRLYHEQQLQLIRLLTDIGIHHQQWSLDKARSLWRNHTQLQAQVIQQEIDRILLQPGLYSSAWLGYTQLAKMKDIIMSEQGENFVLQDFHRGLLNIGSCPFPVLYDSWDNLSGMDE